jgi:hypothetical protein
MISRSRVIHPAARVLPRALLRASPLLVALVASCVAPAEDEEPGAAEDMAQGMRPKEVLTVGKTRFQFTFKDQIDEHCSVDGVCKYQQNYVLPADVSDQHYFLFHVSGKPQELFIYVPASVKGENTVSVHLRKNGLSRGEFLLLGDRGDYAGGFYEKLYPGAYYIHVMNTGDAAQSYRISATTPLD